MPTAIVSKAYFMVGIPQGYHNEPVRKPQRLPPFRQAAHFRQAAAQIADTARPCLDPSQGRPPISTIVWVLEGIIATKNARSWTGMIS
jgi:hypothetical protein